jgi:hypothetical protein
MVVDTEKPRDLLEGQAHARELIELSSHSTHQRGVLDSRNHCRPRSERPQSKFAAVRFAPVPLASASCSLGNWENSPSARAGIRSDVVERLDEARQLSVVSSKDVLESSSTFCTDNWKLELTPEWRPRFVPSRGEPRASLKPCRTAKTERSV